MFRHKVEKITPEIAKIYYSRSTGNRGQAVKTYIAQMKTGRWVLNGETICFDSNGVLRDPNEDLWEIKKAKEDYYINKLMSLETGSLMKDATVWFDNKSMPLDTFKAKCLGQILLTGPYKVYIKRTGTQVDKLNTCNMSVTSYTVTFK